VNQIAESAHASQPPPVEGPGRSARSSLPPCLRLLCIGAIEPSWAGLSLQLDARGAVPQLQWVSTPGEAAAKLRESSFDCVLIHHSPDATTARIDGGSLLQALRASGCDDPVVIVARQADDRLWITISDLDAELLVTPAGLESLALVPVIGRAIARVEMLRENHRLAVADRRRLSRERDEAEQLLNQQRQIILGLQIPSDLSGISEEDAIPSTATLPVTATTGGQSLAIPDEINQYYRELLRTYVIMGSGNLGSEIARLAELLAMADLSPQQALQLHLERVEQLVRGLGNRSTRHVMARADLLVLELMMHLGDCYQRQGKLRGEARQFPATRGTAPARGREPTREAA